MMHRMFCADPKLSNQGTEDMTEFTPLASLFGGALIGLSAVLLMLWEGRIAGISGIAGRLLPPYRDSAFLSRFGFVIGLVAAPLAMIGLAGLPVSQTVSSNLPLMIDRRAAGRLRLGLRQWLHQRPRRVRPVAAVDALHRRDGDLHGDRDRHRLHRPPRDLRSLIMSFIVNLGLGLLFGVGLVVSGMSDPAKVLNFLDLVGTWDPSLAFVMGGAVIVTFVGYRLVLPPRRADLRRHVPAADAQGHRRAASWPGRRSSASAGGLAASVPDRR